MACNLSCSRAEAGALMEGGHPEWRLRRPGEGVGLPRSGVDNISAEDTAASLRSRASVFRPEISLWGAQLPSKNRRGFSTMIWWMSWSEAPSSLRRGSTRREMNV
jgi:hypothetical protein